MIEMVDLTRDFGSLRAVDHLSLSIPAGEVFCFLGPNGAGKTTTIKMLCGLLRPTAGQVLIKGVDMAEDPDRARRCAGYIPDQPYLYEGLTVVEYGQFIGDLYRIPRPEALRRLEEYYDLFGLEEFRNQLVRDLSHGLRQRLVYATTLLHDPEILFVDEPFVGLDPYSIRTIRQTLRGRAGQGMSVFLTTHILALAEGLADRIGIILNGRLCALGTLDDLRNELPGGSLEDIFLKLTGQMEHPEASR